MQTIAGECGGREEGEAAGWSLDAGKNWGALCAMLRSPFQLQGHFVLFPQDTLNNNSLGKKHSWQERVSWSSSPLKTGEFIFLQRPFLWLSFLPPLHAGLFSVGRTSALHSSIPFPLWSVPCNGGCCFLNQQVGCEPFECWLFLPAFFYASCLNLFST